MAKLVLRRKGFTLYAPSQDWADLLAELPENVDLNVQATKARSLSQLGTYWAALSFAIEHGPEEVSDNWPMKDQLSDFLQLETGFVSQVAIPTKTGLIYYRTPKSKSFSECPQEVFNRFFQMAMDRLAELCEFDVLQAYLDEMAARKAA